jgi:hypothetical protein
LERTGKGLGEQYPDFTARDGKIGDRDGKELLYCFKAMLGVLGKKGERRKKWSWAIAMHCIVPIPANP